MDISYPRSDIALNSMFLISDGEKKEGKRLAMTRFRFPSETGEGAVQTTEIRPGMSLTVSDFVFYHDTVMQEEFHGKKVFQISFCIDGGFEWYYAHGKEERHFCLGAQQSQARYGMIEKCRSIFHGGRRCRCLSITLDREMFDHVFRAVCMRNALCKTEGKEQAKVYLYTPNISKILSEIMECPFCDEVKKIYVEGKLLELIAVFCEEVICRSPSNDLGISITRNDYEALLKAKEFINNNFAHPLVLGRIAKAAAINEKKLTDGFKHCFGTTVNGYITEKRMETARELLLTGQYTVSSVTWMMGYSHTGYFIRLFREHYGVTPGDMLKNNK